MSLRTGPGLSPSPSVQPQDLMRSILHDMPPWETTTTGFDFNLDMSPAYTHAPSCSSFPSVAFEFDAPAMPGLEFLDDAVDMDSMLRSLSPAPGLPPGSGDPLPVAVRPPPRSQIASVSRIHLLRAVSDLIDKRLRYTVDAFKCAPGDMVLDGGTPWSHPALYRDAMPACLEGMFKEPLFPPPFSLSSLLFFPPPRPTTFSEPRFHSTLTRNKNNRRPLGMRPAPRQERRQRRRDPARHRGALPEAPRGPDPDDERDGPHGAHARARAVPDHALLRRLVVGGAGAGRGDGLGARRLGHGAHGLRAPRGRG